MEKEILRQLKESIKVREKIAAAHIDKIAEIAGAIIASIREGGKVILFGNGGSAADAQHIAAELVNKLEVERKSLPALALTTNTSILTAVGNDIDFNSIFSRQVELWADKKDIVLAMSTSGSSPNILKAVKTAHEKGALTIGLTGENGDALCDATDICLKVPSRTTPRIQEAHMSVSHIICSLIEKNIIGLSDAK